MRDGEICTLEKAAHYKKDQFNSYLCEVLKEQYKDLRWWYGWKPLRELAFAYYHLVGLPTQWRVRYHGLTCI